MPEDESKKIQISCRNCDVSYWVKWKIEEEAEPEHCPFCGADATITEDEDAIFDDEDEDQDSWN